MKRQARRWFIGIAGGLLLCIGIIAIPYPGPGWAIVFLSLAILSTEFEWAHGVLEWLKERYMRWQKWVESQHWGIRILLWTLTGIVVVVTVWLLNGYGYMADMFEIDAPWAGSPLPWF